MRSLLVPLLALPLLWPQAPASAPTVEVFQYDGYFECRWATPLFTGPCGFTNLGSPPIDLWPNDRNRQPFALRDETWEEVVFEVRWTMVLGAQARFAQYFSYADRSPRHWFANSDPDPVSIRFSVLKGVPGPGGNVPPGEPAEATAGLPLVTFLALRPPDTLPAALAVDMRYDSRVSVFYGGLAPDGYSAFA